MVCPVCGYKSSDPNELMCPRCGNMLSKDLSGNEKKNESIKNSIQTNSELPNIDLGKTVSDFGKGFVQSFSENINKKNDSEQKNQFTLDDEESIAYQNESKEKIKKIAIIAGIVVGALIVLRLLLLVIMMIVNSVQQGKLDKQDESVVDVAETYNSQSEDGFLDENNPSIDSQSSEGANNIQESIVDVGNQDDTGWVNDTAEESYEDSYADNYGFAIYSIDGYESRDYWQIFCVDIMTRELTEEDLYGFTPMELTYLRNSVYAWHGYMFKSEELTNYFSQYDEYIPNPDFDVTEFTAIEKHNADFIRDYQNDNELTYTP